MEKRCSKCGVDKPLGEFYADASKPDGMYSACRACVCAQRRASYAANPAIKARNSTASRKYREANKEALREKDRARRETNRAELNAWHRANYAANRAQILADKKAQYEADRAGALAVYGGRCVTCGSADRLEFDHVYSDGAEHRTTTGIRALFRRIARLGRPLDEYELQLLCHRHHREKTAADRRAADVMYVESRKWDRALAQLNESPFFASYTECFREPVGVGSNAPTSASSEVAINPH